MSTLTPKQEQIAERAYHLYIESGCQHGGDLEHWLRAEKELGGHFFAPPATDKPAAPAVKAAAKKPAAKKAPEKAPAAPPAKKAAVKKAAPAKKAAKK